MCAVNRELQSLIVEEEEGTIWLSVLVFISVLHIGDDEGSTLSVAAYTGGCVMVLYVSLCVLFSIKHTTGFFFSSLFIDFFL